MKLRIEYLFVLCFLIAVACSQEEYVRDYPQITSSAVESNTSAGVTVSASIDDLNIDKVTDVGFVWDEDDQLSIEKNSVMHLGKPESTDFGADIRSQLINGQTYYMRAFAKTAKTVVYGEPMTFKSLGSEGAVIHSVSPTVILPNDVVTITGERFGTDISKVRASIQTSPGFADLMTIQSLTDTEIIAVAPKSVFETARIAVTIEGDNATALSDVVTGKIPKATSITSADLCSPIQVSGVNFLLLGQPTKILVNDQILSPMPVVTETSFSIPALKHAAILKIEVDWSNYFGFTTSFIDAAPAVAVTSVPDVFSLKYPLVLQGANFPTCGGLTIETSNYPTRVTITNVTATQLTISVSESCQDFSFRLLYHGAVVYTSNTIRQAPGFTITSVSPLSGKPGDHITITGTNLEDADVALDDTYLETTGTSTQLIATVVVPSIFDATMDPDGSTALFISGCNSYEVYTFHLDLIPITISDVTPTVIDGSSITITGTNFLSDPNLRVYITDHLTGASIAFYGEYVPFDEYNDTQIVISPYIFDWNVDYGQTLDLTLLTYGRHITFPTPLVY